MIRVYRPQPYPTCPDPSDTRLVGSWLNHKVSGANDYSAFGNNGTPTAVTWERDGAGSFNGTSSLVTIAHQAQLKPGENGNATWSQWVWLNATAGSQVISMKGRSGLEFDWLIYLSTGLVRFGNTAMEVSLAQTLSAARWHLLTVATTAGSTIAYLDGVPASAVAIGTSNGANNQGVYLGAFYALGPAYSLFLNGKLRDVRQYNAALTSSEIAEIFRLGVPDSSLCLQVSDDGRDLSRFRSDLTPTGTPLPIMGGEQIVFNGANNYLRRGEAGWRATDTAGTVLAWIKRASVGGIDDILTSCDEATVSDERFLCQIFGSNKLRLQLDHGGATIFAVSGGTTINAGQWYRVAFVSTGTANLIYVNGVAETLTVNSGTNTGQWLSAVTGRDNLCIGGEVGLAGAANYFDGAISDARHYNRALSASELLNDYLTTQGAY